MTIHRERHLKAHCPLRLYYRWHGFTVTHYFFYLEHVIFTSHLEGQTVFKNLSTF